MKEIDFSGTVSGKVRWVYNRRYCYFRPNPLPFEVRPGLRSRRRFRSTMMNLCRLDGAVMNMTERERSVVSNAMMMREAAESSSVDSEQVTAEWAYRPDGPDAISGGRSRQEIFNYRRALEYGMSECSNVRKITSTVLLKMHSMLMDSPNGSSPGEIRADQNVIGEVRNPENARFVPADAASVQTLLENLLKYINTSMDEPLMKAALAHYQFEAIHPFRDGNGRMGRLLVSLILFTEGILSSPVLSYSNYLCGHRRTYINTLYEVSADDDFDSWFIFFLDAMEVQTERSIRSVNRIVGLRREMLDGESNQNRRLVIDGLFDSPYVTVSDVISVTGMTRPGAIKLIDSMVGEGLLEEITGRQRGKVFFCKRISDALNS